MKFASCFERRPCLKAAVLALSTALALGHAWAALVDMLPSGVKVMHVTEGKGASPKPTDRVRVHYRGVLADGKEFDSSYRRGEPAVFPLNRVIGCWTEGLQTMKIGGKATLICPPATAYGERGAAGVIPPNAQLTFEVELLSIEP